MIFDAQYLPSEMATHQGWGHSCWTEAVDAARRSGAQKLWLMHHAPGRTDAEIAVLAAAASALFKESVFPTVDIQMEALHE